MKLQLGFPPIQILQYNSAMMTQLKVGPKYCYYYIDSFSFSDLKKTTRSGLTLWEKRKEEARQI